MQVDRFSPLTLGVCDSVSSDTRDKRGRPTEKKLLAVRNETPNSVVGQRRRTRPAQKQNDRARDTIKSKQPSLPTKPRGQEKEYHKPRVLQ